MSKKIVVFGSASTNNPKYLQQGYEVGKALAAAGFVTITGGGPCMMAEVNRGAFEAKGESWGICVRKTGEKPNNFLTRTEMYDNFPSRHKMLLNMGEAFVALPGGLGTLHEVLEITQYKKFKLIQTSTPLIFYGDFFKDFISFANLLSKEGFLQTNLHEVFVSVNNTQNLIQALN